MENINKVGSNGTPKMLMNRTHRVTNPTHLTTFNASELVPIYCMETLPGGTYKLDIGTICRMPALKHPVMGKLWLDCYAFYVPYDLLDEKFDKLIGEGHDNTFIEALYGRGSHNPNPQSIGQSITPDLFIPHIEDNIGHKEFNVFSTVQSFDIDGDAHRCYRLLNYLGLPFNGYFDDIKNENHKQFLSYNEEYDEYISAYYIRAYNLIYSSHFRHPFLDNPLITDFNQPVSYLFEEGYKTARYKLMRVNRSPDFFSKGFVSSQLNTGIGIDLGGSIPIEFEKGATAPVYGDFSIDSNGPLSIFVPDVHNIGARTGTLRNKYTLQDADPYAETVSDLAIYVKHTDESEETDDVFYHGGLGVSSKDVYTDISGLAAKANVQAEISINQLRNAIVLQHISEKALYGTDMKTILKTSFAVSLPDYRLDEPLFIGGRRVPIQINQVTNTSNTVDGSGNLIVPTGEYAGQSTTIDNLSGVNGDNIFFTAYNYGVIMVLVCVRHESVYQYGIAPGLKKHDKFDFYWPEFAGLSNIAMKELFIYRNGHEKDDNRTFNFQPYGSEYLNDSNRVSGDFVSTHPQSLDDWHLGDIYNSAPYFSADWMKDTTKEVLQRCIALDSSVAPQFSAYFMCTYTRDIPVLITEPGVVRI